MAVVTRSAEDPNNTPVTTLAGVGPSVADRLAGLGITRVQDLLFHLPLRYEDRTRVSPIGSLRAGEEALIWAEVQLAQVKYGRKRSLIVRVWDGTGSLNLRFFHFSQSQQAGFTQGKRIRAYGEARRGPQGLELVHPEYRLSGPHEDQIAVDEYLTPIYPTTEGVSQTTIRRLVNLALDRVQRDLVLTEHLPAPLLEKLALPSLADALQQVHKPTPDFKREADADFVHPAVKRLAFEELLAYHLSLRELRRQLDQNDAPAIGSTSTSIEMENRFLAELPFDLTAAQKRVIDEICSDLNRQRPMHRLVQGDVGSGKTLVAAVAALRAVMAGYQVALMAPTELLAEQHCANFIDWFEPLDIRVGWLSGKLAAAPRRAALAEIASGDCQLVVGTHALFQEGVEFARLGLVIVDEQHRFGVDQRLALREKGSHARTRPHQLIMTATPIPRTLAMTAYADLDTCAIDELPPGRTPVETAVVPDTRRDTVIARVRDACRTGRQTYWVCTLIEDSEVLQAQAAQATHQALSEALPEFTIRLIHGRLKSADKDRLMKSFKEGAIDLLVATTVIEVGVDVPNASLMIIENAERLGLSQLHQLRGRVGRGADKSACVMLYQSPLSPMAKARLEVLRETTNGFFIAQRDLELRGPGEVLGTRQTGLAQLKIANLVRDRKLLPMVEQASSQLIGAHPDNVSALIRRWVGDAVHYANV